MSFNRGHIPWNKGKHITHAGTYKKGVTPWAKGRKFTQTHRDKLRKAHFGMKSPLKGIPRTPDVKKKLSEALYGRFRGKDSWNYKNGKTPINSKIRSSIEYAEWRLAVYKRDNYECQICGEKGKVLNANHIKRFADFPELRFKVSNGITLCKDCHISLITNHEEDWESYFKFNLRTNGFNIEV